MKIQLVPVPRLVLAAATFLLASGAFGSPADPASIAREVDSSAAAPDRAIHVENLTLAAGPARFELLEGTLVPATPINGLSHEWTFFGKGSVSIQPPDDLERDQLRLFTGRDTIKTTFSSAVFVIGGRSVIMSLGSNPSKAGQDVVERAGSLYAEWRDCTERRLFSTSASLFASALEEGDDDPFFVAWIRDTPEGDFLCVVEPTASEPVTIGQFVPLEFDRGERRRINREIHRRQRRGQLIGVRVDDLGWFNNWISAPLGSEAAMRHGMSFEPERYTLEIDIADRSLKLSGTAILDLRAVASHSRTLDLDLHSDLEIDSIEDAAGSTLEYVRAGDRIVVALPRPVPAGERTRISVRYSGNMLYKEWNSYALRDTLRWYPHAGSRDRATYDVTIRWPKGLEVLAMGRQTDGDQNGAQPWSRRVVDRPVVGFTFEIGSFVKETVDTGHIKVTVAYDPESEDKSKVAKSLAKDARRNRQVDFDSIGISKESRAEIRDQLRQSLRYFEETWGALPYDELTVVTVPRNYSQSLPGFITLSTVMMAEYGWEDALEGVEDRRTVVAHEVAHQWWGHVLGWNSYRDQWISEAMANWCALDYSRKKLDWRSRYKIGPTSRWQSYLRVPAANGRPVETLGPVVLGERLTSSLSQGSYSSIVYLKGAVALDTIARTIGEDRFRAAMRDLLENDEDRILTTGDLVGRLRRGMSSSVGSLSDLFIYGTGIPEFIYSYTIEKTAGGGSHIEGSIEYQEPYHARFRLDLDDSGELVVRTERVSEIDPSAISKLTLVTPVQIELPRRGKEPPSYAENTMLLKGTRTQIDLQVPWDATAFHLDRDETTLCRFVSDREDSKRFLFEGARRLHAEGRHAEAIEALNQSLASPYLEEISFDLGFEVGDLLARPLIDLERQILDAQIHLMLARTFLASGQPAKAREETDRAFRSIRRDDRVYLEEEFFVVESQVDIATGNVAAAHDRLVTRLIRKKEIDDAEAFALLVQTSHQLKKSEDLEVAIREAEKRGVDVSAARKQ